MRVISPCQSELARDRPKRKVLAKVVLQQAGTCSRDHRPRASGRYFYTLHFTGGARYASTRSLNEMSKKRMTCVRIEPAALPQTEYGFLFMKFRVTKGLVITGNKPRRLPLGHGHVSSHVMRTFRII